MAIYYRITLRNKKGEAIYPQIDPNIEIDNNGNIKLKKGNLNLINGNFSVNAGNVELQSGNVKLNSGNIELNNGNITLAKGNITLTDGKITLPLGKNNEDYALDLNDSNIINTNAIYFNDRYDDFGIHFPNGVDKYNTIYSESNKLFFKPNHSKQIAAEDESFTVINSSNICLISGDLSGDGSFDENGDLSVSVSCNSINNLMTKKVINLSSSEYSEDTYYPVVSTPLPIAYGLQKIKCIVSLNSGTKPSWSTHSSGFSCCFEALVTGGGWGTQEPNTIVLNYSSSFSGDNNPIGGYQQLINSSRVCLWLRGGGQYYIYSDENLTWTPYTSSTSFSEQSVSPTTSQVGLNLTRSTIYANLDGAVKQVGDSTIRFIPMNNDELNFGGDSQSTVIYFGFRSSEGRPVPTEYRFHSGSDAYGDLKAGILYSSKNGNTVSIGSLNGSWCHIYNSANIPFYFNKAVYIKDGSYAVGSANSSVKNLYALDLSTWNSNYSSYENGTVGFCW